MPVEGEATRAAFGAALALHAKCEARLGLEETVVYDQLLAGLNAVDGDVVIGERAIVSHAGLARVFEDGALVVVLFLPCRRVTAGRGRRRPCTTSSAQSSRAAG